MWTSGNRRVDDAFLDEVGIFADVKPVGLEQLADHDRAVTAGIVDNLLGRCTRARRRTMSIPVF
jgi:hypothetical protein